MVVGFAKIGRGVIATIETNNYQLMAFNKDSENINKNTCGYLTTNFKVLEIEYINGKISNLYNMNYKGIVVVYNHDNSIETEISGIIKVNNNYTLFPITFYFRKDIAFMHKFFLHKEWEFFENGFTGIFEGYDVFSGSLRIKCLHSNGEIHSCEIYDTRYPHSVIKAEYGIS